MFGKKKKLNNVIRLIQQVQVPLLLPTRNMWLNRKHDVPQVYNNRNIFQEFFMLYTF